MPPGAVLTFQDLSRCLKRSVPSLYWDDALGRLPACICLGNHRVYLRTEIDEWLAAGAPPREE